MKKILIILVGMLGFLMLVSCSKVVSDNEKNVVIDEETSFKKAMKIEKMVAENEELVAYFGGCRIDPDSKYLEIYVVNNNRKMKKTCKECIDEEGVSFIKCKASYKELEELQKEIVTAIWDSSASEELRSNISSTQILVDQNCVMVTMKELTEERIKLFKDKISSSQYIQFRQ